MDKIYNNLFNKNNGQQFYTGTVVTLNPLTVKLFAGDTAISVVPTSNLFGVAVGSKLIMAKIENEFFAVSVVESPKVDSCEIVLSSDQSITNTDSTKIEFDTEKIYSGSNLRFNATDNCVDVGYGISKVKIDIMCWFNSNSISAYTALYIYKNSSPETYSIFPDRNDSDVYIYRTMHGSTIISVEQGDKIYGYARFNAADASNKIKAYPDANKLIVQAVEYDLT